MAEFVDSKAGSADLSALPSLRLLVNQRDQTVVYDTPTPPSIVLPKKGNDFDITPETIKATSVPCVLQPTPFLPELNLRIPPIYDPTGQTVCVAPFGSTIQLLDARTGELKTEIDNKDALNIFFSPLGTFLVTWSQPSTNKNTSTNTADTTTTTTPTPPPNNNNNLRIWNCITGELISSIPQRVFKAEAIQWTNNEQFVTKQITNELQIYPSHVDINTITHQLIRIPCKGYSQYKIAPIITNDDHILSIAFFIPEMGGNPARVTISQWNTLTQEIFHNIVSRTIFGASEASLLWNSIAMTLLVYSSSHVDTSNQSYYGATSVYYLPIKGGGEGGKVEQTKEGQVHDVQWSPDGNRFVTTYILMILTTYLFLPIL
jgi:translation initiation factor 2A